MRSRSFMFISLSSMTNVIKKRPGLIVLINWKAIVASILEKLCGVFLQINYAYLDLISSRMRCYLRQW